MFKVLELVVSVAFFSLFPGASIAEIDASITSAAQPSEPPELMDVVTDGSFKYSIPIDIPAFRGLAPNIGLTYNSGLRSVGRPENILGVGWSLQAFSLIERTLPGGGTPSYVLPETFIVLMGRNWLPARILVQRAHIFGVIHLHMKHHAQVRVVLPVASFQQSGKAIAGLIPRRCSTTITGINKVLAYGVPSAG